MAIVPRTVIISPPSYTITTTGTGAAETYTFVFDPLRYSSTFSVSGFLDCLKLGQPACITINETDKLWSDRAALRLGKLIMVRDDKLVRELTLMLEHALQRYKTLNRDKTTILDSSDHYPSLSANDEVINIAISDDVSYEIPIPAISAGTWSERAIHLRNLESGDLGTLVLDFDGIRLKFVVGAEVDIIFSNGCQSHSIKRSRARAYRMLLQLYNNRNV